jgi:ParB family chromosome partitioning protein
VSVPRQTIQQVPIDLIRPGLAQARRRFQPDALAELAASIRESGVIMPVVLRSQRGVPRGYELLAGERRWRAAQIAGLHEIPALVRDDLSDDEAHVLGLIENLQRESLSPIETAEGLRQLADTFGLTHEQVSARIGKSRAYVSNHLRLLALAPAVRGHVDEGRLSLGHAKVLAALPHDRQLHWCDICLIESLSVRVLERRLSGAPRRPLKLDTADAGDWSRLAHKLSDHLGYPAEFKPGANGAGELRLRFHSWEELEGLLSKIGYAEN